MKVCHSGGSTLQFRLGRLSYGAAHSGRHCTTAATGVPPAQESGLAVVCD